MYPQASNIAWPFSLQISSWLMKAITMFSSLPCYFHLIKKFLIFHTIDPHRFADTESDSSSVSLLQNDPAFFIYNLNSWKTIGLQYSRLLPFTISLDHLSLLFPVFPGEYFVASAKLQVFPAVTHTKIRFKLIRTLAVFIVNICAVSGKSMQSWRWLACLSGENNTSNWGTLEDLYKK